MRLAQIQKLLKNRNRIGKSKTLTDKKEREIQLAERLFKNKAIILAHSQSGYFASKEVGHSLKIYLCSDGWFRPKRINDVCFFSSRNERLAVLQLSQRLGFPEIN